MKKGLKRAVAVAGAITMLGGTVGALAACNKVNTDGIKDGYNTYTSVMPSNWNELTYKDANDKQIMDYIGSAFFEADFAFDESKGGKFKDGKVNQDALISDGYEIKYSAATKLEDVTAEYRNKAEWKDFYDDAEKQGDSYIWKITLRNDLKWDDGTPIDATDFVYTMKEQLNPLFKNFRANSFYDNIYLLNAYNYFMSADDTLFVTPASQGLASNADVATSDKSVDKKVYLNMWSFFGAEGAPACTFTLEYNDDGDPDNEIPPTVKSSSLTIDYDKTAAEYTDVTDNTYYFDYGYLASDETTAVYIKDDGTIDTEKIVADKFDFGEYIFSAKMLYEGYGDPYFEVGAPFHKDIAMKIVNPNKDFSFDKVGIYSPSKYEIVIAFEKQMYDMVDGDGKLAYNAAYEFASLPLVKRDLYEQCKIAPSEGSKLWSTRYNTSLDTTASWGPYKLTAFQSGKSYTLERNDQWYGYKDEDNKDQYQITKINCEKLADINTIWLGLFSGTLDGAGIDATHKDEYRNSKYAKYTPGSATFNQNLYSDLDGLKKSGRNNGILAIKDFRKAVSLAYDREAYNAATTTAHQPALGLLNDSYYYDIANNKRYRDSDQAKKAILRTYGCTEDANGKWSNGAGGNIQNASLEDAYEMVNGYDLNQAKKLVESAYKELTDNASEYGYDPSKKIQILYGTSADNEATRLDYEYVKNDIFGKLFEGTSLEGKVEITFSAEFGATWFEDYVSGKYDLCGGGMSGAVFNPSVILGGFVQAGDSLAPWWDNEDPNTAWGAGETAADRAEKLPDAYIAFKLPEGNYGTVAANQGITAGETIYITAPNLYRCLIGQASSRNGDNYLYNFDNRVVDEDIRLEVLAALEEKVLTQYYSIPTTSQNSASILGAKYSYVTDDYNVFLGHGGIRYMRVNYSFDEWKEFVVANKGDLSKEYKKTV